MSYLLDTNIVSETVRRTPKMGWGEGTELWGNLWERGRSWDYAFLSEEFGTYIILQNDGFMYFWY